MIYGFIILRLNASVNPFSRKFPQIAKKSVAAAVSSDGGAAIDESIESAVLLLWDITLSKSEFRLFTLRNHHFLFLPLLHTVSATLASDLTVFVSDFFHFPALQISMLLLYMRIDKVYRFICACSV